MFNLKNLLIATLLIFAVSIVGKAEAGIVTDKMPLQCYVDHKVTSYDLNSGQAVGWIDAEVDLVQIEEIGGNGVARGTHPGRNGTVRRLFWARDVFADTNYANRPAHVNGYHEVYRTSSSGSTIGSVRDEDVTVVADNGNRAQIVYRLDNGTGYKMGWVPSSVVNSGGGGGGNTSNMHIPDGASIFNVMDIVTLSKKTNGFIEGTKYTGSGECRGFANRVYNQLFGLSGLYDYTNNNYGAQSFPGSHIVGQLHNFSSNDINAVKNLFWNVKPGAIIQMGRRHRLNSKGNAQAPHTAIFFYAKGDGSGCVFYEANTKGDNIIRVNPYTWAELADKNIGFTVYEPDNYPRK